MDANQILAAINEEIERLERVKSLLSADAPTALRKRGRPRKGIGKAANSETRARMAAAQRARRKREKK